MNRRAKWKKILPVIFVIIFMAGIMAVFTYFIIVLPFNLSITMKSVIITIIDLIILLTCGFIINQIIRERIEDEELAIQGDTTISTKKHKSMSLNVYKGKLINKKCQICKLDFEKSDVATQCPKCATLYHLDHLIQWLMEHKECPVCGAKLSYSEVNLL
ncbi:MAG: hypothetical protein FK733_04345 [Asgard group archaeon]|nr:hypothetical protein [Asgard group archaeon]